MGTRSSAAELGETVVAALPHWRRRDALEERLPFLSDADNENETCPKCGRRLPFTFSASALGGLSAPVSEYVHACLVDGPRAKDAHEFTTDEILDAARTIACGLEETECHPWQRLLDHALQEPIGDERDRVEVVGQVLEALRVQGPIGSHSEALGPGQPPGAALAWRDARAALEGLVASSGPHWRSRGHLLR
jgi:hypothetical protein